MLDNLVLQVIIDNKVGYQQFQAFDNKVFIVNKVQKLKDHMGSIDQ